MPSQSMCCYHWSLHTHSEEEEDDSYLLLLLLLHVKGTCCSSRQKRKFVKYIRISCSTWQFFSVKSRAVFNTRKVKKRKKICGELQTSDRSVKEVATTTIILTSVWLLMFFLLKGRRRRREKTTTIDEETIKNRIKRDYLCEWSIDS